MLYEYLAERRNQYLLGFFNMIVIVSMNGKYGIYDREKNDSVTAVDMEYIEYSHYFQPEDGMCFCYFYYEKGLQCGKIGINMNDNTKMEAFADNPRLVGKVEDFPAIDSLISARSYDVLSECMAAIDGIQGQVSFNTKIPCPVSTLSSKDVFDWARQSAATKGIYVSELQNLLRRGAYTMSPSTFSNAPHVKTSPVLTSSSP